MATSMNEISSWFDEGLKQKATHMIVMCDSFSYEEYPVYCFSKEEAESKSFKNENMQRVMEIYNLAKDKKNQLNTNRNFQL